MIQDRNSCPRQYRHKLLPMLTSMSPPAAGDLLAYLRQPGFRRFWDAGRARYISLGRMGGRIELAGLTPEEQ